MDKEDAHLGQVCKQLERYSPHSCRPVGGAAASNSAIWVPTVLRLGLAPWELGWARTLSNPVS